MESSSVKNEDRKMDKTERKNHEKSGERKQSQKQRETE